MRRSSVSDMMTGEVVTVRPDTPFADIVRLMTEHRISGVPVVHPSGRVLGIVSENDLILKEEFKSVELEQPARFETSRRRHDRAKAAGFTAADVMSSPALAVTQDVPVVEAARILTLRGYKRLPVVDRGGQLVGIVTRSDLLRVFLRPDVEIRDEITEQILRRYLSQDIRLLKVEVSDGVVHLSGKLSLKGLIPMTVRLVSAVEGVARVIEDLDYEDDDTAIKIETLGSTS